MFYYQVVCSFFYFSIRYNKDSFILLPFNAIFYQKIENAIEFDKNLIVRITLDLHQRWATHSSYHHFS